MAMGQRSSREMTEGECIHHWIIDSNDVGHCIKPGCGAVRDFGKELRRLRKKEPVVRIERGMRGRPRKTQLKGEFV